MLSLMPENVDMRPKRHSPFHGSRGTNPLSMLDEVALVPVPAAIETHEPRKKMRGYLSGTGGPLDNLFGLLDGKQPQAARKIEVVRNVPVAAEPSDDDDGPSEPPPRFGKR